MARLNEPPSESLESLKRRFIRQNRDLARTNSSQSIKIRALESEISRLLAENVSLRERNVQLEGDLEDVRKRDIRSSVDVFKMQMESKVQELQSLLKDLAGLNKRPRQRRSSYVSTPLNLERRSSTSTIIPPEGLLPTIVEGKYFPRVTLEQQEIQLLAATDKSDSSDIGPPPCTSLDQEEPESHEGTLKAITSSQEATERDITELLLANFETRRKRRNSQLRQAVQAHSEDEVDNLAVPPLRIGSKRKFSAREQRESEPEPKQTAAGLGSFTNTHETKDSRSPMKVHRNQDRRLDPVQRDEPVECRGLSQRINDTLPSPRKALSIKPVNTDPVISPRKPIGRSSLKNKDSVMDKSNNYKSNEKLNKTHCKSTAELVPQLPEPIPEVADILVESSKSDPKTPAAVPDIFSPDSAPASSSQTDPDMTARITASEGPAGPGRVSRRARAAVSYAEPSLVSKMRRPTKELVDAVVTSHSRRSGSVSGDFGKLNQDSASKKAVDTRTVQLERNGQAWQSSEQEKVKDLNRPEPQSPLRGREPAAVNVENSNTLVEPVKKRSRTSPHTTDPEVTDSHTLEKGISNLDIFDVQDSPPSSKSIASASRSRAQARRQTINSTEPVSSSFYSASSVPGMASSSATTKRSTTIDRPSSALSQRASSNGVKQMRSVSNISKAQLDASKGDVERMVQVSRRKSMMV